MSVIDHFEITVQFRGGPNGGGGQVKHESSNWAEIEGGFLKVYLNGDCDTVSYNLEDITSWRQTAVLED